MNILAHTHQYILAYTNTLPACMPVLCAVFASCTCHENICTKYFKPHFDKGLGPKHQNETRQQDIGRPPAPRST